MKDTPRKIILQCVNIRHQILIEQKKIIFSRKPFLFLIFLSTIKNTKLNHKKIQKCKKLLPKVRML